MDIENETREEEEKLKSSQKYQEKVIKIVEADDDYHIIEDQDENLMDEEYFLYLCQDLIESKHLEAVDDETLRDSPYFFNKTNR